MSEIKTIHTCRCSRCGHIFQDANKAKLEEYMEIHEAACSSSTRKWEHKGPPPEMYYSVRG